MSQTENLSQNPSASSIENALMESLKQLVDLQQLQGKTLRALGTEQSSAHTRMNDLQTQINTLAESVKQSVNWQMELISRLEKLENLRVQRGLK